MKAISVPSYYLCSLCGFSLRHKSCTKDFQSVPISSGRTTLECPNPSCEEYEKQYLLPVDMVELAPAVEQLR